MLRTLAARVTLLLGLACLALVAVEAQQAPTQPTDPLLAQDVAPLSEVEVVETPSADLLALQVDDMYREAAGLPPRFASPFVVNMTPSNSGRWEASNDGRRVWRLRVRSPGAVSLNLGFAQYVMPPGGRLFLYTPDHQQTVGPFTDLDNDTHGELWTPILSGDEVVIEVSLPGDRTEDLVLELDSVNRGYRTLADLNKSGSCNVDVICSQGDAWREQIRAVGASINEGSFFCTGALINNTSGDGKPYFLTADHCGITSTNAASVVVYWNYINSVCRTPGGPASGLPGDGVLTQFQTGAFFRASYAPTDVTLIELDDTPNPGHGVFLAGWDRGGANATSAVAIHHPNGEEKRISFEDGPTTITSFGGTSVPGDGTHLRVGDWDLGTTEVGSSGSPLFDQSHRIIGQLHGGEAACGNNDSDWYGRLASSWTGGGTASSRLSDWLDPGNTGATTMDGREGTAIGAPWTDSVLVPTVTPLKAIHVVELRTRIDALRAAHFLQPYSWSEAISAGTVIKAIHVQSLREALNPVGVCTYTNDPLVPGTTSIKAIHVQELRNCVVGLE